MVYYFTVKNNIKLIKSMFSGIGYKTHFVYINEKHEWSMITKDNDKE